MSSEIQLKRNFYSLRCTEVKNTQAQKSGLPMKVLTFELFNAPPVMVDGQQVDVNGHITFNENIVLSEKALPYVNIKMGAFGLPPFATIDDALSFDYSILKDQTVFALCESVTEAVKDDEGNVITNPVTGKPHTRVRHRLSEYANKFAAQNNQ